MNLIEKAITFATEKHSGQFRKQTTIPYILHCLEAGTIATSLTSKDNKVNEELVAAAILHDTVEDADVTLKEIKKEFGDKVAYLVDVQSEDKSKTWQERKDHTIDFLKKNEDVEVEIAIISDKLSNVRSLHKEYHEKGDELWEKFNAPKEKQKWYYTSIGLNMKKIVNTPEHKEYQQLLKEIFN